MKNLLVGFFALLLVGCVSGYAQFYTPNPNIKPDELAARRVAPPPVVPQLDHSGDMPRDIISAYMREGYIPIGHSSFNGNANASDAGAIEQGKKVGADVVVVVNPHYLGTRSTVIPWTTPTTQTSFTTGSATAYGDGGPVTAYGNAVTTTYGSQTTYIPVSVDRYAYLSIYFVKRTYVFGANWRGLSDAERQQLQTNKGVYILNIVNGTPAFKYDVLPGDIILEVDGQSAASEAELNQLFAVRKGKTIELTIVRNGQRIKKSVLLGQ